MPDAFEEQAVLVAAEQAAAEGDTIAAEGHLRTLLELQTARLGPEHAEVASTLHNLAVVCERAGRLSEAEALYRRASTVATAVLPPGDPLVVRCREDLHAFLELRNLPLPATDPTFAAPPGPVRTTPPSNVRSPSATRTPGRPPSRVRPPLPPPPRPSLARWIVGGAGAAALVAIAVLWMMFNREPAATEPAITKPPAAAPAAKRAPARKAASTPMSAAPGAQPVAAPSAAAPKAAAPTVEPADEPAPQPPSPDAAGVERGGITLTDVRLCRELSTAGAWTCVPVAEPLAPGRVFFLTRLDVPAAVEVVHRWYHGEEVIRSVSLRVPPAGRPGYRTYSRLTIDPARTGPWRVELRSADGAVLAENRFTVQ
jgi:hypothetical protein